MQGFWGGMDICGSEMEHHHALFLSLSWGGETDQGMGFPDGISLGSVNVYIDRYPAGLEFIISLVPVLVF